MPIIANFTDFRAGLNKSVSQFDLYPNECQDCLNVYSERDGNLRKRYGVTPYNIDDSTVGVIYDLMRFYDESATANYLLYRLGDSLYQISSAAIESTELGSVFTGKTVGGLDSTIFNDKLYIAVDTATLAPLTWDGTTFDSNGYANDFPVGTKYITTFENRLIGFSEPAYPDRLMWTAVGADTYTSGDDIDINPQDGDNGTGIVQLGGGLLVFKEDHCYFVAELGDMPYVDQIQIPNLGCISHKTIIEVEDGVIFMARDGVWHVDRSLTFRKLSKAVDSILRDMTLSEKRTCCASYWQGKYFLSFKYNFNSTHNRILVLDRNIILKQRKEYYYPWWLWDVPASSMVNWSIYDNKLYFGNPKTGVIGYYDESAYDDSDSIIDSSWVSGDVDFGAPEIDKIFEKYRHDKTQFDGTLSVTLSIDGGKAYYSYDSIADPIGGKFYGLFVGGGREKQKFGTATFAGATVYRQKKPLPLNMVGKRMRTTFSNRDKNESWRIYGYGFNYFYDSLHRS